MTTNYLPLLNTTEYRRYIENKWRLMRFTLLAWLLPTQIATWVFIWLIPSLVMESHSHRSGYHWTRVWVAATLVSTVLYFVVVISTRVAHDSRKWVSAHHSDLTKNTDTGEGYKLKEQHQPLDFREKVDDYREFKAKWMYAILAWPVTLWTLVATAGTKTFAQKVEGSVDPELAELKSRLRELRSMEPSDEVTFARDQIEQSIAFLETVPKAIRKDEDRIKAIGMLKDLESFILPAKMKLESHKELMMAFHEEDMAATRKTLPALPKPPAKPKPQKVEAEVMGLTGLEPEIARLQAAVDDADNILRKGWK